MQRRFHVPSLVLGVLCVGAVGACGGSAADRRADNADAGPEKLATIEGFSAPESALYDEDSDKWFVSNINGNPSAKDGNGFISRLNADGRVDVLRFIESGRNNVTLNAPKGMALVGDTLWVSDIDVLRAFHRVTGRPLATIDLGGVFLNDVAEGADGTIYVTDTGIHIDSTGSLTHPGPDRLYAVGPDRKGSVVLEGDALEGPNGITWDHRNNRLIIVPDGGTDIMTWKPGQTAPMSIGTGPREEDGVEVLDDGRILYSSWADSSVHSWEPDAQETVITGIESPADFGIDHARRILAIPSLMGNRVEMWKLP